MRRKKQVMGIINLTPDSFNPWSRCKDVDAAVERAVQMEKDGADILDIGAQSTRPGSRYIDEGEELRRLIPPLKAIREAVQVDISVDTQKPAVAAAAVEAGANIINDIEGFRNPEMQAIALDSGLDICVMHMQKFPEDMQENPHYPLGVVFEVNSFFEKRLEELLSKGIKKEKVILDPGWGFGKTLDHNLALVREMASFKKLGCRLLMGLARKLALRKFFGKEASELLPGTLALNACSLIHGDIVRVYSVKEHRDAADIIERMMNPVEDLAAHA